MNQASVAGATQEECRLATIRVASFRTEALREEASTGDIPSVLVESANPLSVRVAVLTDENGAHSVAFVVAAVVMLHS